MSSVTEGGCACGACRFELHGDPMFVQACHCTDCRRSSGAPFLVNIWIESENVVVVAGDPASVLLGGGESGKPCEVWYCSDCGTALWSRYHVSPGDCRWVRAGTLDDPARFTPDAHIWTRSKLAWVPLPEGVPVFEQFYDLKEVWPAASLQRLRANIEAAAQ